MPAPGRARKSRYMSAHIRVHGVGGGCAPGAPFELQPRLCAGQGSLELFEGQVNAPASSRRPLPYFVAHAVLLTDLLLVGPVQRGPRQATELDRICHTAGTEVSEGET